MHIEGKPKKNALIAIPALNEEKAISFTLDDLVSNLTSSEKWNYSIAVIDDGSTDKTSSIAKTFGVIVLKHPVNCGVGAAMRTAFQYAEKYSFDAVVQVDADGQHPVNQIEELIENLVDFDLVVGSRFLAGPWEASFIRRAAMRVLTVIVRLITGISYSDPTSGFRASGRRAISVFAEGYPSEYLGDTVESLVLAHQSGLKTLEIPAKLEIRIHGNASHTPAKAALHVFRAIGMILIVSSFRSKRLNTRDVG